MILISLPKPPKGRKKKPELPGIPIGKGRIVVVTTPEIIREIQAFNKLAEKSILKSDSLGVRLAKEYARAEIRVMKVFPTKRGGIFRVRDFLPIVRKFTVVGRLAKAKTNFLVYHAMRVRGMDPKKATKRQKEEVRREILPKGFLKRASAEVLQELEVKESLIELLEKAGSK